MPDCFRLLILLLLLIFPNMKSDNQGTEKWVFIVTPHLILIRRLKLEREARRRLDESIYLPSPDIKGRLPPRGIIEINHILRIQLLAGTRKNSDTGREIVRHMIIIRQGMNSSGRVSKC